MSGDRGSIEAAGFDLNATAAPGTVDHGTSPATHHEFKVFNVTLISLALCILAATGIYWAVSFHRRRRMSKRAHVYESAVGREEPAGSVDVRAVKRSVSFRSPLALFRKQEASKDNSRIYYIYSNPLPVGVEEEVEEEEKKRRRSNSATAGPEDRDAVQIKELTMEDYAKDPASGIILDPPNFYMQL